MLNIQVCTWEFALDMFQTGKLLIKYQNFPKLENKKLCSKQLCVWVAVAAEHWSQYALSYSSPCSYEHLKGRSKCGVRYWMHCANGSCTWM